MLTRTTVGSFAYRRELLFTVKTVSACNLERGYNSLANLAFGDAWAYFLDDATELMTKNVTLLHFRDGAYNKYVIIEQCAIGVATRTM